MQVLNMNVKGLLAARKGVCLSPVGRGAPWGSGKKDRQETSTQEACRAVGRQPGRDLEQHCPGRLRLPTALTEACAPAAQTGHAYVANRPTSQCPPHNRGTYSTRVCGALCSLSGRKGTRSGHGALPEPEAGTWGMFGGQLFTLSQVRGPHRKQHS